MPIQSRRPPAPGLPHEMRDAGRGEPLRIDAGGVQRRGETERARRRAPPAGRRLSSPPHFSRIGGTCPLWNVDDAFAQPGRILTQLAVMPDERAFPAVGSALVVDENQSRFSPYPAS